MHLQHACTSAFFLFVLFCVGRIFVVGLSPVQWAFTVSEGNTKLEEVGGGP
jgi:hypothetical protein